MEFLMLSASHEPKIWMNMDRSNFESSDPRKKASSSAVFFPGFWDWTIQLLEAQFQVVVALDGTPLPSEVKGREKEEERTEVKGNGFH